MTFISYAQNFEDVMLWRALHDVERGFWIDVGAAHPTEYSVTRAFSDRHWCGVNVEPEPTYAAALRLERPHDINIEAALGKESARLVLHRFLGTGLSTFDAGIAARHVVAGYPEDTLPIEVTTLAAICQTYAPAEIHFLKIDVEGFERDVLLGADFSRFRPWIVVAEATIPSSPVARVEQFADVLEAASYRQCWFDGLNAFFVAAEHEARLAPHFKVPLNVFDGFMPVALLQALQRAERAEAEAALLTAASAEAEQAAAARAAQLNAALQASQSRAADLEFALTEALGAEQIERRAADAAAQRAAGLVQQLESASAQLAALQDAADRAAAARFALASEHDRLERLHRDTVNSTSWRLMGPMRAVGRRLKSA